MKPPSPYTSQTLLPAERTVGARLLADERAYRRKAAVDRGIDLADRLDGYPAWRRHEWLRELAAAHLDPRTRPPLRHQLFRRHLAPFVLAAYRDREPGAARWLLLLHRRISSSAHTRALLRTAEEDLYPIQVRALDDAPDDIEFRRGLIRRLMNDVDHWGARLADGRADHSTLALSRGRPAMLDHVARQATLAIRVARDLQRLGVEELRRGDTPEAAEVRAEATLGMIEVTRERHAFEDQMTSRKS